MAINIYGIHRSYPSGMHQLAWTVTNIPALFLIGIARVSHPGTAQLRSCLKAAVSYVGMLVVFRFLFIRNIHTMIP
jgi:hypothetical protein